MRERPGQRFLREIIGQCTVVGPRAGGAKQRSAMIFDPGLEFPGTAEKRSQLRDGETVGWGQVAALRTIGVQFSDCGPAASG